MCRRAAASFHQRLSCWNKYTFSTLPRTLCPYSARFSSTFTIGNESFQLADHGEANTARRVNQRTETFSQTRWSMKMENRCCELHFRMTHWNDVAFATLSSVNGVAPCWN